MNHAPHNPAESAVVVPSAAFTTAETGALVQTGAHAQITPPPGVESFYVPGVGRVLGYPDRPPAAAPAVRPVEPLPVWVKATALLMPTGSVSLAVTTWALSHAVAAFEAITAALWAAAGAAVAVGGAVGATALAVRSTRKATGGPTTVTATAEATSRNLLGGRTTAQATAVLKR